MARWPPCESNWRRVIKWGVIKWVPRGEDGDDDENMMEEEVDKSLHMKGQMHFMADWNVVMFLCSPAIANVEQLAASGLFICDLSMHDFSRDLLLASSQQSNELKASIIIWLRQELKEFE